MVKYDGGICWVDRVHDSLAMRRLLCRDDGKIASLVSLDRFDDLLPCSTPIGYCHSKKLSLCKDQVDRNEIQMIVPNRS